MKFMTQKLHAMIDYPVAIGLFVMPFLLGLGTSHWFAFTLSVVTSIAALILTALTDHETGVIRILPYKLHLAVDAMVGAAFVLAPFVFGFTGLDAAYYWVLGATVLVVVGLHSPTPAAPEQMSAE
ncbi:MAG: hypothetical protein ABJL99_25165 [Aliishimia sp.]